MNQTITPIGALSDLHQQVTQALCELAKECVQANGVFRVSLSGGSTPKVIYQMLADEDLPWEKIHWFWGDERNVAHDHDDSNCRMVHEALLSKVPVPKQNIHPVPVDVNSPQAAALKYDQHLRGVFDGQTMPMWDLVLLGMGDDAHTASLFPSTQALAQESRWFVENWVEKFDAFRYTLTAPAINSASEKWFLVAGEAKKQALALVLGKDKNLELYPSQLISPTRWFVTADAWTG